MIAGQHSSKYEVTLILSNGAKSRFADDMILAKQFNFRSAKIRDVLSAKWQKLGLTRAFNIAGGDHRAGRHIQTEISVRRLCSLAGNSNISIYMAMRSICECSSVHHLQYWSQLNGGPQVG